MKKNITSLAVSALVLTSVMWINSVNAADDFDALLNSLTDDTQTEQTVDNTNTQDNTAGDTNEVNNTNDTTEWEVDLESLATDDNTNTNGSVNTTFDSNKTYSDEAKIEIEPTTSNSNLEYEPEDPVLEDVNTNNDTLANDTELNNQFATNDNVSQKQLTPTGLNDFAILFVAMFLSLGIFFVRRKKS